jgi:hypothetical protein
MSFQPVVPISGFAGWRFLERTLENQQTAFAESQPVSRATDYFRDNIANVTSAADLVADRQLLSVALGAFGLDDDINNTFFVRRILEDGTLADDALANRLTDSRYSEFSRVFGFGDLPIAKTTLDGFADDIVQRFEEQQFAKAVGEQNNDMRLALNVSEGVSKIIAENSTNTGQWFSIMGNPPLRQVFQTALGLPNSIANVDVDQQRQIFEDRAESVLGTGTVADLSTPDIEEKLIRLFLVRSEAAAFNIGSSGSTALTLLQSSRLILT